MEREWKEGLGREHGIAFDRLITLNNMPISRYLEWLESSGNLESYLELLVASFNPGTIDGLMCRNTLSIGWDGRVYDCDFNQMLDLSALGASGGGFHVRDLDVDALSRRAPSSRAATASAARRAREAPAAGRSNSPDGRSRFVG